MPQLIETIELFMEAEHYNLSCSLIQMSVLSLQRISHSPSRSQGSNFFPPNIFLTYIIALKTVQMSLGALEHVRPLGLVLTRRKEQISSTTFVQHLAFLEPRFDQAWPCLVCEICWGQSPGLNECFQRNHSQVKQRELNNSRKTWVTHKKTKEKKRSREKM